MARAIQQPAGDDHCATVKGAGQPAFAVNVRREESLHEFWIPQNRRRANERKKFVGKRTVAA